jgi:hypothetical protein
MTKRFSGMKLFSVLLALTLVLSCSLFVTVAKYSSNVSISDSATVAAWSFTVNDKEIATSSAQNLEIDLFSTIMDTKDGKAETDVKSGLLAPGTTGSFALNIKNTADVNATYTLALSATNAANIPLEFSTDGGKTWSSDLATVTANGSLAMNATKAVTVNWRWAYEGDDTALGIQAQGGDVSVVVTATLTATQAD